MSTYVYLHTYMCTYTHKYMIYTDRYNNFIFLMSNNRPKFPASPCWGHLRPRWPEFHDLNDQELSGDQGDAISIGNISI